MALSISPTKIVESGKYPLLAKHSSWERVPLTEVASVQNGFPFESKFFDRDEGTPLIRIRDVGGAGTEHRYKGEYDSEFLVNPSNILVGMDGDFRASRWKGAQGLLNQRVCRIVSRTSLFDEHFLLLCLQPFLNAINAETSSVTVKHLSSRSVEDLPLPLPPLREQRRIIAKIEELFSELDKGVEALTTAREQLEIYRLVVLHQSVCSPDGFIYPAVPLDKLIGPIEQGWSPKCDLNRKPDAGEWAIIKTTVVQPMSYLPDECKPLPNGLAPKPDIEIHDGDILMTRKGPRIRTGVVCYVNRARPRSMLCDTVYRFRANEQRIDPEYLALALNSPHVVQAIDRKKSGISESGISLNHARVRSIHIPVPPSKELQRSVVFLVRERLSLIEHTQMLIDEEIQRATAIRQSILKQAFSGQLVAQDPADEPASELLKRIHAERAKASAIKPGRKSKKIKKEKENAR